MTELNETSFTEANTSSTVFPELTSQVVHNATLLDHLGREVALGIFFGLTILFAVGGNLLVCTAVFTDRRLKTVKNNYFIVSLALADLLVSGVVMIFAMVNDIQQRWVFGEVFCRIWISLDVMCSTASILNLCVISLDRYKHVQDAMYYDMWMTNCRTLVLIGSVWFLSALISFLPIHLRWHQTSDADSLSDSECIIKLNFLYAIVSSTISFYAPCLVMLVMYFRLFLFARGHAISIKSQSAPLTDLDGRSSLSNGLSRSSSRTSDYKAAFTLGIITGVFLTCWLPFFIINPINAYNPDLVPPSIFAVSTWLGYVNSCLNPIIYSIFNTEFREAFQRILCLRGCRRKNRDFFAVVRSNSQRARCTRLNNEPQPPSDNGSSTLRKASTDPLFYDRITRL